MTPNIAGDDLTELKQAVALNRNTISRFGGRLAVLYKFIDAVLPQLSAAQREEAAVRFRRGIEDVMSFTDDIALPTEYHEALLEQTNILLAALEEKGVR